METQTITINMDKEVLEELRKQSDNKKGFLGKTISKATREYLKEKKQEDARKSLLKKLEKGYNMGGLKIKSRDEIHDRYETSRL